MGQNSDTRLKNENEHLGSKGTGKDSGDLRQQTQLSCPALLAHSGKLDFTLEHKHLSTKHLLGCGLELPGLYVFVSFGLLEMLGKVLLCSNSKLELLMIRNIFLRKGSKGFYSSCIS